MATHKKTQLFITVFFLLFSICGNSFAAVIQNCRNLEISGFKTPNDTVVKHSSFIQIPQNMIKICVKSYKSFHLRNLFHSSKTDGFISNYAEKAADDKIYSGIMLFNTYKSRDNTAIAAYGGAPVNAQSGGMRFLLLLFVISQILLFLSALHKGSIPNSVNNIHKYIKNTAFFNAPCFFIFGENK